MRKQNRSFSGKLAAYSLAAGAGALMASAAPSQAVMNVYDNGGAGWYDLASGWNQDTVSFKMDGTVVLNTANTGLLSLGQDADSFTFQVIQPFMWWGTEAKEGFMLHIGANVGYVTSPGDWWGVGRLGGDRIGPTMDPATGRGWSNHAVTSTGGLGGWNFYFAGEWPFGGGGCVGLYADVGTDRHYGWANMYGTAWWGMEVYEFAFSDVPGQAVWAGGGEATTVGDFTGDGTVNDLDIDKMGDAIRNGSTFYALYDISADGVTGGQDGFIDTNDLDYLIRFLVEAGAGNGTEYGDFNLDGIIDTTDLTRLATDYGVTGDTWAKGNANRYIDLLTDTTDLTILATYYGFGVPDVIPEPMTLSLLALGASGLLRRRKR